MHAKHLLAAIALCVCASAQAFSCAPTGHLECRLELSTVTVVFDAGVMNFDGDSQTNGPDAFIAGYTVGAGQFPDLTPLDLAGGTRAGFSFDPGMYGAVGGSGFNGYFEASASFLFTGLRFEARPGFAVTGVEFTVAGARDAVGTGYVALNLPTAPLFTGSEFVAGRMYGNTEDLGASFYMSASYLEGEDGTAASYGTASARFSLASVVAHVTAVPEPATAWLLLAGGVGIAAAQRRRGRG